MRTPTLALGCVLLAGAPARALAAGGKEPTRIEYHAPDGCPGAADFEAGVFGRTALARRAEPGERARTFVVSIRKTDRFVGTLRVRELDGSTSRRQVATRTCRDTAEALELFTALAIDPNAQALLSAPAATTTPSPGSPPAAPAPPPVRKRGAVVPPRTPRSARPRRTGPPWRLRVAAGTGAGVAAGIAPSPMGNVPLFVDLDAVRGDAVWVPGVRVALSFGQGATPVAPTGGFVLRWVAATVLLCGVRLATGAFEVRVCAAGEAGSLRAASFVVAQPVAIERPWLGLGGALRAAVRLAGRLRLGASAALVAPLFHDRIFLSPGLLAYEVPSVGGRLDLLVGLVF